MLGQIAGAWGLVLGAWCRLGVVSTGEDGGETKSLVGVCVRSGDGLPERNDDGVYQIILYQIYEEGAIFVSRSGFKRKC